MKNSYEDYFENQYKLSFTEEDILSNEKWFTPQWNKILQEVDFKDNPSILEIGSAYGGFYYFINGYFDNFSYTGLELDKKAVEFASEHFKVDYFKNEKLEEFKNKEKYDYIFAFEVLEHLTAPIEAITKIKTLLNDDGKFVGTSPYPFKKNVWADKTHTFVLHPSNWEKLFSDIGFSKVETFPMSFVPYIWRIDKRLNVRIPIYLPFKHFISTALIIVDK